MLDLVDIAEEDLKGILFAEFPVDLLWDEARDRLELLILESHEELFGDYDPDECLKPCVSPFWIYQALRKKNRQKFKSVKERRAAVLAARKRRDWMFRNTLKYKQAKGVSIGEAYKAVEEYRLAEERKRQLELEGLPKDKILPF